MGWRDVVYGAYERQVLRKGIELFDRAIEKFRFPMQSRVADSGKGISEIDQHCP